MKKLIIFRHGKSNWDVGVSDRERDLEEIGIERTQKSAQELVKRIDFNLKNWYSSPAKRAFKTAEIASTFFTQKPNLQIDENLYTFSFFDLLKVIKNFDSTMEDAIIFGHNEAFTEFINRMGNTYLENLPTSGVALIEFDQNQWTEIENGKTKWIIKPNKL